MGSIGAMVKGSADRYGQKGIERKDKLVPEGVEGRVPYRGMLGDFVYQLVGGLRAGMGYCGTPTIDELRKRAKFVRVSGGISGRIASARYTNHKRSAELFGAEPLEG